MNKVILLDGGMGTMLQASGMRPGEHPEIFAYNHPDTVKEIHRKYIDAGSGIIYANTFGANSLKLDGTGYSVSGIIENNIGIAKEAAGDKAGVALDIGPAGELLEPMGALSFDKAYEIYAEVVRCGAAAGADLCVIETFTDLADARAALLAVKENSTLPVYVTMSFEKNGRTFTGTSISSAALTLEGLGADAIGINCSLGPEEIYPMAEEMSRWTSLPLIIKPNAGLPDPITGEYHLEASSFARSIEKYSGLNLLAIGGCCGTTPEFISELKNIISGFENKTEYIKKTGVCSPSKTVTLDKIRVVGERINPTGKKKMQEALAENDMNYIMSTAIEQSGSGAEILDINVGMPGIDEAGMMTEVVKAVQSVCDLPLQIDSGNPDAIEAGLRAANGISIVNSVNGDDETLDKILPIVKKYGAYVVGLTLDKNGIPENAEQRIAIAERIIKAAQKYGIDKEKIIIDCLTLTVSAQQSQAMQTLVALREIKERYGVKTTLGVSNISFGLPARIEINRAFLGMALQSGLDLAIINPNIPEMMDTVAAVRVLKGQDDGSSDYIKRFALSEKKKSENTPEKSGEERSIEKAVLDGIGGEVAKICEKLLGEKDEIEVINEYLIPALDIVGEEYEKGALFLPQLISSANAACAGFDLIKERLAKKGNGSISKGRIILATVEGDIHDIGKNIVKTVLENYGYDVIDLGKNVPVASVVDAAVKEDIRLIGLSALMSTTVPSMERTIRALRESGHNCKVFVGGAVLTRDTAMKIGADYYAKDAKESVDIAKEFFG